MLQKTVYQLFSGIKVIKLFSSSDQLSMKFQLLINVILRRLHYVPGGHGGHVSDNHEQNGITMGQRRVTG